MRSPVLTERSAMSVLTWRSVYVMSGTDLCGTARTRSATSRIAYAKSGTDIANGGPGERGDVWQLAAENAEMRVARPLPPYRVVRARPLVCYWIVCARPLAENVEMLVSYPRLFDTEIGYAATRYGYTGFNGQGR
eukprot:3353269-Rhodomonas_salina.1